MGAVLWFWLGATVGFALGLGLACCAQVSGSLDARDAVRHRWRLRR